MRFCGFVEPTVVLMLLMILVVQTTLILYLLTTKKFESYKELVDAEMPAPRQETSNQSDRLSKFSGRGRHSP